MRNETYDSFFGYRPSEQASSAFHAAFNEGGLAAMGGAGIEDCPHPLPEQQNARLFALILEKDPRSAGWLLGWWCADMFGVPPGLYNVPATLYGAKAMAALLLAGWWPRDRRAPQKSHYSEEEIAEALACSVEEVHARAVAEGWPYLHEPKKPGQPVLKVYPQPQNNLNGLGPRFEQIRESLGKSQLKMSALLKIGRNAWQNYERGRNVPGGRVIASLAQRGFNAHWILTGEGEMRVRKQHPMSGEGAVRELIDSYTTLIEIATALGVSKKTASLRAKKAKWPYKEVTCRGGVKRLYPLQNLPEPISRAVMVSREQRSLSPTRDTENPS